jgi:Bifunctional DNA primase/polymerase, N-terminal/Protein of unknown function (DUF3987)
VTTATTMLDAAVEYARRGVPVFPVWGVARGCCACGSHPCGENNRNAGKHPHRLAPHGFKNATVDEATIRAWWTEAPDANIGAPTGQWCDVVDVDPRNGGDVTLAELERRHGPLPDTAEVLTGGGGRHIYFAPTPTSLGKTAGTGIDIKTAGGYVLLPPSGHVSGGIYLDEILHPLFDTPLARMPAWLVTFASSPASELHTNGHRAAPDEWVEKLGGAPEGQRRAVALQIAGHYLGLRIPPEEVTSILVGYAAQCVPPFSEREARELVRDLARRDQAKKRVAVPGPPPPGPATPLRVPDAAVVGIARDFADLYSRYLETPRSFLYFAFLTYCGSVLAKKITLASALAPEPRLYTVVLGESADTRKSTALRVTDDFWRSLGSEWEPRVLHGVGSAEGIAAELKDRSDLLLHFDEFKAFVDKAKNEHSIALPMVATLYERGDYDNRTKTERLSIRGASLSVLAACTADTYATMFDQRFFAIGLLNRLWLVTDRTTERIAVPKLIPELEVATLRDHVRDLLQDIDARYARNGLRPIAYHLTPAAEEVFTAWYRSRCGSIFERRLDSYGHRLMILLAATSGRTEVDQATAEAVIALLGYQLEVRRECDPVDAENTIAALEERIRRVLARGALKGRDLKRRLHSDRFGLWAWNTAVSNLIQADEVRADRASDTYWLVPAVTTSVTTPQNGISANAGAA